MFIHVFRLSYRVWLFPLFLYSLIFPPSLPRSHTHMNPHYRFPYTQERTHTHRHNRGEDGQSAVEGWNISWRCKLCKKTKIVRYWCWRSTCNREIISHTHLDDNADYRGMLSSLTHDMPRKLFPLRTHRILEVSSHNDSLNNYFRSRSTNQQGFIHHLWCGYFRARKGQK